MINSFINVFVASFTAVSMVLSGCQTLIHPAYDYSQPVPEHVQQEDSWFDGSAVIGHSLMEGFEMFSKVDADIHYFTATSLSAGGAVSKKFSLPNGGTGTLADGLKQKEFSKVYIMLGVNEITTSKDRLKTNMANLIQTVRDNQPEGIPIYVLNLTPSTKAKSDSTAFNQTNIKRLNEALAELCQEQECYLVDLWSCFADENGYLPASKSTDGVHLKAPQYRVMADYLLCHTVEEG